MKLDVVIPEVGEAGMEVTFAGWLRAEGDEVREGDPLFELDTAKSIMEVQAFASGTLTGLRVSQGDPVSPQQVVAQIETQQTAEPRGQIAATDAAEPPPAASYQAAQPSSSSTAEPAATSVDRAGQASPRARRLAAERGIDLGTLEGSGPGGIITERDVLGVRDQPSESERVRQAVARRTVESWQTIPHFSLRLEADVTDALQGLRPMALVSSVAVRALIEHPEYNLGWDADRPATRERVDLGILVDTPNGLLLPAVRRAEKLEPTQLEAAIRAAAERARAGALDVQDAGSHSITISNLGMFAVDEFTGVIPTGDVLLLSLGRVREVPRHRGGEVVNRRVVTITLSADHRALSGADAARLLTTFERILAAIASAD